jgi:DNA-binding NtrC family response regulator
MITVDHALRLADAAERELNTTLTMRQQQRQYALRVLRACGGHKRRACTRLRITWHTLQRLITWDGVERDPRAGV